MPDYRPSRRQVIATAAVAALPFPAAAQVRPLRITQRGALRTRSGASARPGLYREPGAVSPDGRLIALAPDEVMALFDATTGEQTDTVSGSASRDYTAVFSPGSESLVVGSYRTVRLYDVVAQRERWRVRFHPDLVWDPWTLSFRPGAHQIALTGSSDVVLLLDANNGGVIRELRGHTGAVFSHAFTPDGARLVSGPDEADAIIVWDAETGQMLERFVVARGVWSALSQDGESLICTQSGAFDVWSLSTQTLVRSVAAPFGNAAGRLRGTLAGPNGEWLVVAAERANQVQVFDWKSGERLLSAPVDGGEPSALAAFADGATLLFGDPARIWTLDRT